jgi:hypothetical protein
MAPLQRPRASTITTNSLRLIADGDLISPKVITATLTNALEARDYSTCLKNLQGLGIDPQSFIDGMDKVGSPVLISDQFHERFNFRR